MDRSMGSMDTAGGASVRLPGQGSELSVGSVETMRPKGAPLGRIDQYELVRELGGGGFGTVYLARDTVAGVDVAVKGLPPLVKNNAEELERIRENFALVSKLYHPNIAAALHLHPAKDVSYADERARQTLRVMSGDTLMVMAYAPGVTLNKWRKQFPDGRVPAAQALEVCRQIAAALDYAHGEKVVHRDVKPGNVMVESRSQKSEDRIQKETLNVQRSTLNSEVAVRVLDFGLAAEIRSSMSRVSQEKGDTSGTRPYMAPEQWAGRKQDGRTDQYALAALFHELVSGAVPFASAFETGDPVIMANAAENKQAEPLPELSKAQNAALQRGLAKEPAERFASCGEFVKALAGERLGRADKTHRPYKTYLALLAAAAALGLAGYRAYRSYRSYSARLEGNLDPTLGNVLGMAFVGVAPGSFQMGSSDGESDERPVRTVRLTRPFWMGKHEVTQREYETLTGRNPSRFKGGDLPVETVSWDDAVKFCEELTRRERVAGRLPAGYAYRLPTEAEWEYAARGGAKSRGYAYSGGNDLGAVGWFLDNSGNKTQRVGTKAANELGLHDMSGNVWEWCHDWYQDSYNGLGTTDSTGPASGSHRVRRGGSWDFDASFCRSAYRIRYRPSDTANYLGFRVVLAPAR